MSETIQLVLSGPFVFADSPTIANYTAAYEVPAGQKAPTGLAVIKFKEEALRQATAMAREVCPEGMTPRVGQILTAIPEGASADEVESRLADSAKLRAVRRKGFSNPTTPAQE